jgi:biotin carboxylase
MGETTARAFRDKLAMRRRARSAGIACPEFVHVLNYDAIRDWTSRVPAPWVLKPRSQAAAIGIRKLHSAEELWCTLEALGDAQAEYLLEQFIAGDVFHVDSIVFGREVRFGIASRYRMPPMSVAHEGGIFVTRTLPASDPASPPLHHLNARVLDSFGLLRGASHTEFIHATDGTWYFLETSARVGGAFIVDVVEAASGVNLWREWAHVEIAGEHGSYEPPAARGMCGGIVLSLARQETPDMSAYDDPEIAVRIRKSHHAGLIVTSPSTERVDELLEDYTRRFYLDFHASAPPLEKASE